MQNVCNSRGLAKTPLQNWQDTIALS